LLPEQFLVRRCLEIALHGDRQVQFLLRSSFEMWSDVSACPSWPPLEYSKRALPQFPSRLPRHLLPRNMAMSKPAAAAAQGRGLRSPAEASPLPLLRGLGSAVLKDLIARPELNGSAVEKLEELPNGRVLVQLLGGEEQLSVKAACLQDIVAIDLSSESEEGSDEEACPDDPPSALAPADSRLPLAQFMQRFRAQPESLLNAWSAEVCETQEAATGETKQFYRSCTVLSLGGGRMYGLHLKSDAKGAQAQCELAAMKLGLSFGKDAEMQKAAMLLTPAQRRHFEVLAKLHARTKSSYEGEAKNAARLLKSKLELPGMESLQQLLQESADLSRARKYSEAAWSGGSRDNAVTVIFLGEKTHTDFFSRLGRFAASPHGCFHGTGKFPWAKGIKYMSMIFYGRLSSSLDAAMLAMNAADLAFSYADKQPRRQDRLSGFMDGLAVTSDRRDVEELRLAEISARKWTKFAPRKSRGPVKRRSGEAFEDGKRAGAAKSIKRTECLEA